MKKPNTFAPIIIFTYNRLTNLEKLLISLSKNTETKFSKAYFFIDGPKNKKDQYQTDSIFRYLKKIKIFKTHKIIYRNKNFGSAKSILNGLNYISKIEKKFIVLEDDLIVSKNLLSFCNQALKLYEREKKIWHINCWIFKDLKFKNKFFFSTHMSCWGWATWSDRWKKLKKINKKKIYLEVLKYDKKDFEFLNIGILIQLLLNYKKKINTWAIYWYYTIFLSKGITITPFKTLVINEGFKSSSQNTKINYYREQKILNESVIMKLKYKKPNLDKNLLYKINKLYNKYLFLYKIFSIIKEFIYKSLIK